MYVCVILIRIYVCTSVLYTCLLIICSMCSVCACTSTSVLVLVNIRLNVMSFCTQGHLGESPFDSATEWSKTHFAAAATAWPHAVRQSRLSVSIYLSVYLSLSVYSFSIPTFLSFSLPLDRTVCFSTFCVPSILFTFPLYDTVCSVCV